MPKLKGIPVKNGQKVKFEVKASLSTLWNSDGIEGFDEAVVDEMFLSLYRPEEAGDNMSLVDITHTPVRVEKGMVVILVKGSVEVM